MDKLAYSMLKTEIVRALNNSFDDVTGLNKLGDLLSGLLSGVTPGQGGDTYDYKGRGEATKNIIGHLLKWGLPAGSAIYGGYKAMKRGENPIWGGLKGLGVGLPMGLLAGMIKDKFVGGGMPMADLVQGQGKDDSIAKMLALDKALAEAPDEQIKSKATELRELSPKLLAAYEKVRKAKDNMLKADPESLEYRGHALDAAKGQYEISELNKKISTLSSLLKGKKLGLAHMLGM